MFQQESSTDLTPSSLKPLLLLLLCCVWWPAEATSASSLRAVDDHIERLGSGTPDLSRARLESNDKSHTLAWLEIVEPPRHGHLVTDGDGGYLYIADQSRAVETDRFRYRWRDATSTSNVATVSWRFAPRRQPLAGRWPTRTCHPGECQADGCREGEGAEVGWYDRLKGVFYLCDWVGARQIDTCGRYQVPPEIFTNLPAGGRALVLDWDADGWDDPAILDPSTGEISIFKDTGLPCEKGCFGHCLDRVAVIAGPPSAQVDGRRSTPLAGRWQPGSESFADQPAWIDEATGYGWWRQAGGSGQLSSLLSADSDQVLAGDWLGAGFDTLAFWHASGDLEVTTDLSGQGVILHQFDVSPTTLETASVFEARISGCSPSSLAFFSPEGSSIALWPLVPGHWNRAIMVDVPADPDGWPGMVCEPTEEDASFKQ